MGLKHLVKPLQRFCVVILVTSTFVVPVRAHCDSYGLRNAFDDVGDWQLSNCAGPEGCLICFFGMPGRSEAELVLPCLDQNQKRISRFMVSYIHDRPGNVSPLRSESSNTACKMYANDSQLNRTTFTASVDQGIPGSVTVNVEQRAYSYYLKASEITPNSFICLEDVKYCMTDHTTTTSSHSSPNDNQNTASEQKQSKSPIWVIIVIIAIVIISICAVAVFIRRRKQHDHQPANNVNAGSVNGKSNGINDNMKNNKDVIANPTYDQEPVNGKEEEYHSYTEIDVKIPGNSEMIYNSAYESQPASSDMVYNSAYESPPASSDMVYNSAYESSPSS